MLILKKKEEKKDISPYCLCEDVQECRRCSSLIEMKTFFVKISTVRKTSMVEHERSSLAGATEDILAKNVVPALMFEVKLDCQVFWTLVVFLTYQYVATEGLHCIDMSKKPADENHDMSPYCSSGVTQVFKTLGSPIYVTFAGLSSFPLWNSVLGKLLL